MEAFDHKYLNEEMAEFRQSGADDGEYVRGDLPAAEEISGGAAWSG